MKKAIPTFKLSINDVFKTKKQKDSFRALLKSQGANSVTINSSNQMTFCNNSKKLTTLSKKGKLLNIHTDGKNNG